MDTLYTKRIHSQQWIVVMNDINSTWLWIGFSFLLVVALSADALFINKKYPRPHQSMHASVYWTIGWVSCALSFNVILWFYLYFTTDIHFANTKALMFLTGYLIEQSLSVDNLFVFYLIFHQFRIPAKNQRRVLSYGIWGAVVMRLTLILIGVWLVKQFHWLLYLMGAFLVLTGLKIIFSEEKEKDLADTLLMKVVKRCLRTTSEMQGERFFIKKGKLWYATPLFIALIFVEFSDLVFAMDSIPAIFAITTDPFIIWSSNIFAILGLRSLYFFLVGMVEKFQLLKYGISLILMFVGCKMLIEPWFKVPVIVSLGVIVGVLTLFTVLSIWWTRNK